MSIIDLVKSQIASGMLFPLVPQARGAIIRRTMLVTEEVQDVLFSPVGDLAWEERVANLRADLEVFVTNETVDPKYLFHLYPAHDGVWEIRSVSHDPSIRVLGLFVEQDVFVATNIALREHLGGWNSRAWKHVKRRALARWRAVFNTYNPVLGTDAKLLVTGAIDGKYFKSRS